MKRIKTAVIVAVVAEATLCIGYTAVGRFSFVRSEDTNLLGHATVFFHLPGLLLAKLFFGDKFFLGAGTWKECVVAIITGAVQFFLLTWAGLAIRSKIRRPMDDT